MVRADSADFAVLDPQRSLKNFSTEQRPAAFNQNIGHDTALRRGAGERPELVAASYFARNSSTASCRKSGKVLRRVSWSQFQRAGADAAARQNDGAVPDPDVVTDMDAMAAPPFEELGLVALAFKIRAGAIGEVRVRRPLHRMIAGVDSRHRRNRAEFSDGSVGDLRVVHDIGIVVHRHLVQDGTRANLAIGTEPS